MFILATDHLGLLQREGSAEFENLRRRISSHSPDSFFVTIISFHEQINGWTAYIARGRTSTSTVRGYEQLERILTDIVLLLGSAAMRRQHVAAGVSPQKKGLHGRRSREAAAAIQDSSMGSRLRHVSNRLCGGTSVPMTNIKDVCCRRYRG